MKALYGTKFLWMTQLYGHLDCDDAVEPLDEFVPIGPEKYSNDIYKWRYFTKYDSMSHDYAQMNVTIYF